MFRGIRGLVVLILVTSWLSAQDVKPSAGAGKVPNVVGLSAKEAKGALTAAGLLTRFKVGPPARSQTEAQTVRKVEPPAGTQLKSGAVVQITVYGDAPADDGGAPSSRQTTTRATPRKLPGFVGMTT